MSFIRLFLGGILSLFLVNTAHAQGVWDGYVPPNDAAPMTSTNPPRIFLQNLSEEDREIAIQAATVVEAVLNHPGFARLMDQENPRVSCSGKTKEKGSVILDRLLSETIAFSLVARKPANIALAEFPQQRVAIMPSRFTGWHSGNAGKGKMVATLIHEMTHMVPNDAGTYSRYTDNRPLRNLFCRKSKLASYRVTHVVNEFWLNNQDEVLMSVDLDQSPSPSP